MKNRALRVSALLLVFVMLTACMVGGTFAKYTTSAGDDVTARVANWGFERTNTIVLDNLFSNAYVKNGDTGLAVKGLDNSALLVAPGTKGSVDFQFAYDQAAGNAPEVAYTFTVDTTGSDIPDDLDAKLVWSLDGTKCGNGTFDELLAAIKGLSGDVTGTGSKVYAPNTLPVEFGTDDKTHTVSWVWAFDGTGTDEQKAAYDTTDTALGNANALANVQLKIAITATQID